MGDFYETLKHYKEANKLNYQQLADAVLSNVNNFRMAVHRKALSKLEMERLQHMFDGHVTEPVVKEDEYTTLIIDKLFQSDAFKERLKFYINENIISHEVTEQVLKYYAGLMKIVKEEDKKSNV